MGRHPYIGNYISIISRKPVSRVVNRIDVASDESRSGEAAKIRHRRSIGPPGIRCLSAAGTGGCARRRRGDARKRGLHRRVCRCSRGRPPTLSRTALDRPRSAARLRPRFRPVDHRVTRRQPIAAPCPRRRKPGHARRGGAGGRFGRFNVYLRSHRDARLRRAGRDRSADLRVTRWAKDESEAAAVPPSVVGQTQFLNRFRDACSRLQAESARSAHDGLRRGGRASVRLRPAACDTRLGNVLRTRTGRASTRAPADTSAEASLSSVSSPEADRSLPCPGANVRQAAGEREGRVAAIAMTSSTRAVYSRPHAGHDHLPLQDHQGARLRWNGRCLRSGRHAARPARRAEIPA